MRHNGWLDQEEPRPNTNFRNKKPQALLTLALGLIVSCSAVAYVSRAHNLRAFDLGAPPATPMTLAASTASAAQRGQPPRLPTRYVSKGRVWPKLRETLRLMGNRLEKPGKERLIMSGTLTRIIGSQTEAHLFRLTTQFPGLMRLEVQDSPGTSVIVFNGRDAAKSGGPINRDDEDLIETLVFDTIDHFFAGQMQGAALRTLGERFRLDDGTAADYTDGFYDIYEVIEETGVGSSVRQQTKLYYINSDTLLLERVRYQLDRGAPDGVEVQIKNWRRSGDQLLPSSIARFENRQKTLELAVDAITIGPGLADGIFDKP